MHNRLDLHELLCEVLGSRNVYYSPPESVKLKYPAIVYSRSNIENTFADDSVYKQAHLYSITIIDANPDIIITCAYGQILCEEILNIPKLGCFNLHGSLLPKYRGGAPIHYALLNGDEKTGITLMYMDKGMDSGDMIAKEEIKIEDNDNIESLTNKLSIIASNMIIKYLPSLIDGTNNRVKQDISKVTFSPIIKRIDEHLDFNVTAKEIFNRYRMLSPNPLPNIKIDDIEYKIAECKIVDASGKVSTVVSKDKNSFTIMAKDKGIMVSKIKPIGKNIMNVKDFFNGYHDEIVGKEVK